MATEMSKKVPLTDVEKYTKRIYDCVIPSVLLHRSLNILEVEQAWFTDYEPLFLSEALVKAGFSDLVDFLRQYPDDVRIDPNLYCGAYLSPGPRPPKLIEDNIQLIRSTQSFKKPNPYNQERGILSRKYQWRYRAAAEKAKLGKRLCANHSVFLENCTPSGASTLSERPFPASTTSSPIVATRVVPISTLPPHGHHISQANPPSVSGCQNGGSYQIPSAPYSLVPASVAVPNITNSVTQLQASWINPSDLHRPAGSVHPAINLPPGRFCRNLPSWYIENSSSGTSVLLPTQGTGFVPRSVHASPMSNKQFLSSDRKTDIAMEKYTTQSIQFGAGSLLPPSEIDDANGDDLIENSAVFISRISSSGQSRVPVRSMAPPMGNVLETPTSVLRSAVRVSAAVSNMTSDLNKLSVKFPAAEPTHRTNDYTQTMGIGLSLKYLARIRFYQERREKTLLAH